MHRKSASVLATAAVVAAFSAAPAAATPTLEGSCHGQQVSGFAHDFGGAAHAAEFFGVSVQDGQRSIRAFCAEASGG